MLHRKLKVINGRKKELSIIFCSNLESYIYFTNVIKDEKYVFRGQKKSSKF